MMRITIQKSTVLYSIKSGISWFMRSKHIQIASI